MKDEYLIWKRVEDSCKEQIRQAEELMYINIHMKTLAKEQIKKLEKAGKVPKHAKSNSRPMAKPSS